MQPPAVEKCKPLDVVRDCAECPYFQISRPCWWTMTTEMVRKNILYIKIWQWGICAELSWPFKYLVCPKSLFCYNPWCTLRKQRVWGDHLCDVFCPLSVVGRWIKPLKFSFALYSKFQSNLISWAKLSVKALILLQATLHAVMNFTITEDVISVCQTALNY